MPGGGPRTAAAADRRLRHPRPGGQEETLRALVDLQDLARYVGDEQLRTWVDGRIDSDARAWVRDGNEQERRHRLRTLGSMVDQRFADQIRDELEFL